MLKFTKKIILFFWVCILIICGLVAYKTVANRNKNKPATIPIAMSMDDNYVYPTIVSITSIMKNKNKNTSYCFYIMHPQNLSYGNKEKVQNLGRKYNQCDIKLIDMKGNYDRAPIDSYISTPTYYRLSLSELVPNLDKIIWLDGDTLVFHDLNDMFNINMSGYYYKGFLDNNIDALKNLGIYNDHYICAGVMLINLKELRENNMVEKFQEFIEKNNDKLVQHDQTVINAMCMDEIGVLPAKFGIFNCINNDIDCYVDNLTAKDKYTLGEVRNAIKDPWVLHCVSKPWNNLDALGYDKWWEYARETDYFEEIKNKYRS